MGLWGRHLDPVYYVPLVAMQDGPATVTIEESFDRGYWIGRLNSGDKVTAVAGFERGPLEGLVKIPKDGIGTV